MEPLAPGPNDPIDITDPWIGRTLDDKYYIEHLIAAGGMGRVYKAVQRPLNRAVAVKILLPRTPDEDLKQEFKKRFFREAATCARLQHPNTVTLFDYGEIDRGTVYMVMELVQGRTLKDLLRESQHLDAMRALRIAHEIALSLREAHRIGLVHRDLKPSNVMVHTDRDNRDSVKVLDFGLVKLLDPETSNSGSMGDMRATFGTEDLSAVRKGVVVGSPGYMSPEQIESNTADRRSDIYALGVILFELLTGFPPFKGVNAIETLMLHVSRPAPRVSEHNDRIVVPDEVEKIVSTCLKKDPEKRYQRVDELIRAIRSSVPPDMAEYEMLHSLTDNDPDEGAAWWRGAIVGILFAALVLGTLLVPPRLFKGTPAAQPAQAMPPIITIQTEPAGAAVFVDDDLIGRTPLEFDGTQERQVLLKLEGYRPYSLELTAVDQNERRTVPLLAVAPETPSTPEPTDAPKTQPRPSPAPIFNER